jgi:hypothetical protein
LTFVFLLAPPHLVKRVNLPDRDSRRLLLPAGFSLRVLIFCFPAATYLVL